MTTTELIEIQKERNDLEHAMHKSALRILEINTLIQRHYDVYANSSLDFIHRFTVRTQNVLRSLNIKTAEDLYIKKDDLNNARNFGKKSAEELNCILTGLGLPKINFHKRE